jgi:hypothetical protein
MEAEILAKTEQTRIYKHSTKETFWKLMETAKFPVSPPL